ncbi:MAG: hypothetical protein FWC34_08175 [Bacteroidetes bacterium]|nr:hypothetical protein [Bacteroidota bacterium]MCL2301676.1 hypothetical protein [Lentimicrobiaceae bacterium]
MNKNIIKSFDKAIVLLLFAFGVFSSCDKNEIVPMYGVVPEYGVPIPDNSIKNVVIHQETTNHIQDVPVISEVDLQDENAL